MKRRCWRIFSGARASAPPPTSSRRRLRGATRPPSKTCSMLGTPRSSRRTSSGATTWTSPTCAASQPRQRSGYTGWSRPALRSGRRCASSGTGVFATAVTKLIQARVVLNQIDMLREYGMGSFRDLLLQLSRDPAMLVWLDNQDNHKGSINENYGRGDLRAVRHGGRQLHRGRHQRVREGVHRLGSSQSRLHVHPDAQQHVPALQLHLMAVRIRR